MSTVKDDLNYKAQASTVHKILAEIEHYTTTDDLDQLHDKVMPKMEETLAELKNFRSDNKKYKKILSRYDELLS